MLQLIKYLLPIALILPTACGVKGKPQPPLKPAFIGNGEPLVKKKNTYKGGSEGTSNSQDSVEDAQ